MPDTPQTRSSQGPHGFAERSLANPEDSQSERTGFLLPKWVLLLAANWKILVGGAVLAGAIAAIPQLTAPRQYTAESLIAPTVSWTQVQFEPKIKTIDSNSGQQGTVAGITPERRQALVDLIRSSTIEQDVLKRLAGKVPDGDLQAGSLIQHISGGLKPRSEILGIQAVADSPDSAVLLASTWAKAYVDSVNHVYTPPDADTSITQLRDTAQLQLQKAQDALTASLRDSRLEALDRQINEDEQMLKLLRAPYQLQAASPTPAPSTTNAAQTTVINASSGSTGFDPALSTDYRFAERRTLDDIAQTLRRLDATRESVRALISQTPSDSSGAASAAAISLIKAQLVSVSGDLPSQMQFQMPVSDSGVSRAELETLVSSIEQARTEVAAEFDKRRQAYESHRDQQMVNLEDELRGLRAQREQSDAERKQLTAQRDLAAETYNALARKAEETTVAQGTQGHEVELASEASFALQQPRFSMPVLAGATLAGLVLAAAFVLLASVIRSATQNKSTSRPRQLSGPTAQPAQTGREEHRVREAIS